MVGPGFVVDVQYFKELGTYDDQMSIWGGENLELPWRVRYEEARFLHIQNKKAQICLISYITGQADNGLSAEEIR